MTHDILAAAGLMGAALLGAHLIARRKQDKGGKTLCSTDIEKAARILIETRGRYAFGAAELRAQNLRDEGYAEGEEIWLRVAAVIQAFERKAPASSAPSPDALEWQKKWRATGLANGANSYRTSVNALLPSSPGE